MKPDRPGRVTVNGMPVPSDRSCTGAVSPNRLTEKSASSTGRGEVACGDFIPGAVEQEKPAQSLRQCGLHPVDGRRNATIAPGANTSIGFQGTWTNSDVALASFTLNGTTCTT